MPRNQLSTEQFISKHREIEVISSQDMTVIQAARGMEINEQTFYRWHQEYGGLDTTKTRKLKELVDGLLV